MGRANPYSIEESVGSPSGDMLLNFISGSTGRKGGAGAFMDMGSLFGAPGGQQGGGGGQMDAPLSYHRLEDIDVPGNTPHGPQGGNGGRRHTNYGAPGATGSVDYDTTGFGNAQNAIQTMLGGGGVAGISPEMMAALRGSTQRYEGAGDEFNYVFGGAMDPLQQRIQGAQGGGGFGYRNADGSLVNTLDPNGQNIYAETLRMGNQGTDDLMSAIDREASKGISMEIPEVTAQMEAAGLGRSGANTLGVSGVIAEIMGQANRTKAGVLTELQESNLNRASQAMNFGEDARLRGLGMEADVGAQGLEQLQGMQNFRQQTERQRMLDMLGIGEQNRAIEQQRLSQQLDTQMMPVNMLMQLVTGSPGGGSSVQAQNPWAAPMAQVGSSLAGNVLGGGGGATSYYDQNA